MQSTAMFLAELHESVQMLFLSKRRPSPWKAAQMERKPGGLDAAFPQFSSRPVLRQRLPRFTKQYIL